MQGASGSSPAPAPAQRLLLPSLRGSCHRSHGLTVCVVLVCYERHRSGRRRSGDSSSGDGGASWRPRQRLYCILLPIQRLCLPPDRKPQPPSRLLCVNPAVEGRKR